MHIKEIMTWGVECIDPNASVQQAAQKMRHLDIGCLPVCTEGDRLVGMLTDRDIAIRACSEGLNPAGTRVRQIMTPDVVYCFEDQDLDDVSCLMESNQIRRILVLNRNKRLVGIVSLGDFAVDADDEHLVGHTLEAVSEPAAPRR